MYDSSYNNATVTQHCCSINSFDDHDFNRVYKRNAIMRIIFPPSYHKAVIDFKLVKITLIQENYLNWKCIVFTTHILPLLIFPSSPTIWNVIFCQILISSKQFDGDETVPVLSSSLPYSVTFRYRMSLFLPPKVQ